MMIFRATAQASRIIGAVNPDCVLGMGGFVTGPGGVAARLRRRTLLIHEQNAVPGLTNKLLAPLAHQVLEAFPDTFPASARAELVGNPVRQTVAAVGRGRQPSGAGTLRVLVLGGSQGAQAINKVIPALLANWKEGKRPEILHQAGRAKLEETELGYRNHNVSTGEQIRVVDFIDDMAAAYQWADLVICRSGASTVAEIAAAGLPAILIPYPHHKDRQQLKNARWLADEGAALVMEQAVLTAEGLTTVVVNLDHDRARLKAMSGAAIRLAITDADERIADRCLEAADV
jgi:UDP-N-acetylglucosamine--N-acetylmuramyl-(pentapeptide) pyrophosphoryl-undecaprenol N-acetylglucosamine transferase